jgi:hypothetical protein
VPDLSSSEPSDSLEPEGLRVMLTDGPLGAMRLTVRAIAAAEGFVVCRHGSLRPQVLSEREWQALPLADAENFDL